MSGRAPPLLRINPNDIIALMYTKRVMYKSCDTVPAYTADMSAPKKEHQDAIAAVRNSFADVTGRARYSDEPTVLTARSKRVAAVVSMEFYDWARTVAAMLHAAAQDPDRAAALRAAGVDLTDKLPGREPPMERTLLDQAGDYRRNTM